MLAYQLNYDASSIAWFGVTLGSLALVAKFALKPRTLPVDRRLETVAGNAEALEAAAQAGPSEPFSRRARQAEPAPGPNERMIQAGLYSPNTTRIFNVVRVAALFVPILAGLWLGHARLLPMKVGLLLGVIFGLAGTLAPGLWLDRQKRIRQVKIRRALPDALDVISVCLQGGLNLNVALAHVARELKMAHPALASELNILQRQIEMGRSTGDAIREMANRFDLDELRTMSSVIRQADKIGSSVAAALDLFAESMRVKRHQKAEEHAHKAAVKLLIPTLLFVFPATFIVILGPAVVRVLSEVLPGMLGH